MDVHAYQVYFFKAGRQNQLLKPKDSIQSNTNLNNKSPGYYRQSQSIYKI